VVAGAGSTGGRRLRLMWSCFGCVHLFLFISMAGVKLDKFIFPARIQFCGIIGVFARSTLNLF